MPITMLAYCLLGAGVLTAVGQAEPIRVPVYAEAISLIIDKSAPDPVRVQVSGSLPDPCTMLTVPQQQIDGDTIQITLEGERDPNLMCAQVLEPFEATFPVEIGGLAPGDYTVRVNEISAAFTLDDDMTRPAQADPTLGDAAVNDLPLAGVSVKLPPRLTFERVFDSYGVFPAADDGAYWLTFSALPRLGMAFETPEGMLAYLLDLDIDDERIARADDLPYDSAVMVTDYAGYCRLILLPTDRPRIITVSAAACADDFAALTVREVLNSLKLIDIVE